MDYKFPYKADKTLFHFHFMLSAKGCVIPSSSGERFLLIMNKLRCQEKHCEMGLSALMGEATIDFMGNERIFHNFKHRDTITNK